MPAIRLNVRPVLLLACAAAIVAFAAPSPARAQVVVVANGSPITELDIQQRSKLVASSSRKNPSRQEVINDLIDDRIKIAKAKVYGLEASETEVENAFENMARRQRITPQQFGQLRLTEPREFRVMRTQAFEPLEQVSEQAVEIRNLARCALETYRRVEP